jgi:hypothetical protein
MPRTAPDTLASRSPLRRRDHARGRDLKEGYLPSFRRWKHASRSLMDRSVILWELISAISLGRSAVSRGSEVTPPSHPSHRVVHASLSADSHPPQPHGAGTETASHGNGIAYGSFTVALVAPRLRPTDPYGCLVDVDNVIYTWSRSTNTTSCLRDLPPPTLQRAAAPCPLPDAWSGKLGARGSVCRLGPSGRCTVELYGRSHKATRRAARP